MYMRPKTDCSIAWKENGTVRFWRCFWAAPCTGRVRDVRTPGLSLLLNHLHRFSEVIDFISL